MRLILGILLIAVMVLVAGCGGLDCRQSLYQASETIAEQSETIAEQAQRILENEARVEALETTVTEQEETIAGEVHALTTTIIDCQEAMEQQETTITTLQDELEACGMSVGSLRRFQSQGRLKHWVQENMSTELLPDRAHYAIHLVERALEDGYWMSLYLHRRQSCPITEQLICYTLAGEHSYMVDARSGKVTELEIVLE